MSLSLFRRPIYDRRFTKEIASIFFVVKHIMTDGRGRQPHPQMIIESLNDGNNIMRIHVTCRSVFARGLLNWPALCCIPGVLL